MIWSFAGDAVAFVLSKCGLVNWYVNPFEIRTIQNLVFLYPLSPINGPGWFVIMLFWVEIAYILLNKLLRLGSRKRDYLLLVFLAVAGFFDLKLCMEGLPGKKRLYLFILRTIWYLQFYHIGRMLRLYWEKYVRQWRLLYTCGVCVAVNLLLVCLFGDKLNFFSTSGMGKFNSWWLPLCTSITGTLFWYKIMQMAAERIGQVSIVDFIAENTFTMMMCHLMFANIPNFAVYLQALNGSTSFSDFPVQQFVSTPWSTYYSPTTCLAGFFCGLFGSMLVALLINKAKQRVSAGRLANC